MTKFNDNCRFFRGDRPCNLHKLTGAVCEGCSIYDPIKENILIIKLGADGDVLRTTSLLPALKKKYPKSYITWVTELSASPLLMNNPLIDRIYSPPELFYPQLMSQVFDFVINPDADDRSCSLASIANGKKNYGFIISEMGRPKPLSGSAKQWFNIGVRDDIKRANRQLYQQLIYEMADLNAPVEKPQLFLTDDEITEADKYLISCNWLKKERPVVGINTGAGMRWPNKALPVDTLEMVIEKLLELDAQLDVFLLGGPDEKEKNRHLGKHFGGRVIDTGTDNAIRHFAAIITKVDVVLSADSLAMHIGIALGKYVIAYFGPTSPWEICLYGQGEKIVPDISCISCYSSTCNVTPACNELISPDQLIGAIVRGIARKGKAFAF